MKNLNQSKHTPGKWTAKFDDMNWFIKSEADGIIARLPTHGSSEPEQNKRMQKNAAGQNLAADAALIAAAPEMLEALKELVTMLTDGGVLKQCEDKETTQEEFGTLIYAATCLFNSKQAKNAMALIAKAEGRDA